MMNTYCSLCRCYENDTSIHVLGKRHSYKMKKFQKVFGKMKEIIKYHIISFIFSKICDKTTLWKHVHMYQMKECTYELFVMNTALNNMCNQCRMPLDFLSYENFCFHFSKQQICMNCAYNITSNTNFLSNVPVIIMNARLLQCSETMLHNTHYFYRFNRIEEMLINLKKFHNRNNYTYLLFDLTYLPFFWTIQEFLYYLNAQSLFLIEAIGVHHQQIL